MRLKGKRILRFHRMKQVIKITIKKTPIKKQKTKEKS